MPNEKQPYSSSPEDNPVQEPDSPSPVDSFSEGITEDTEGSSVEELTAYIERLERDYRSRLHGLMTDCLSQLSEDERELISSDPELQARVTFALAAYETTDAAMLPAEVEYHPTRQEIAEVAERIAANAHRVDPYFQREAAQIAWETGTVHIPGPVKEAHRIAEKLEREYGIGITDEDELLSSVKDTARCRLVIESDPLIADEAIIERIEESRLTIALDHNNVPLVKRSWWDVRTGRPIDSSEDDRYRDTKVTVTVVVHDTNGNDVLCEIAIVTPEMSAATVAEHPLYEIRRSLGDELTPSMNREALASLRVKLAEAAGSFYRSAHEQVDRRLNSQ